MNTAYNNAKADASNVVAAKEQEMFANLGVADIFHYAFNYVGVLTGKTFYLEFTFGFIHNFNI